MLRKMVQCSAVVNRDMVRRQVIDGVEHVIVSSYTLPDNVVMNGLLYPAEEIEASYHTLERTLAPIEHPTDGDGNFLLAGDPHAIHNFYAGAWNENVTRENGRVHIEKHINVQEAMKSERGKRLMDRINEIETNSKARPIHTSTGLLLTVEELDKPLKNKAGQEYNMIAREMAFDHDAILLDSIAAATPEQGVGMAVNSDGDKIKVERINIDDLGDFVTNTEDTAHNLAQARFNASGIGSHELCEQLTKELQGIVASDWLYIVDIFDETLVFETNQGYFEVPYRVDDDVAKVVGIPIRVEKDVTYTPKVNKGNKKGKGDAMKDLILNALTEAGIDTKDMDDAALMEAYNTLLAKPAEGGGITAETITEAVNAAVKPLADQITTLEGQVNSAAEAERAELVKVVTNSDKYAGLTDEAANALDIKVLANMAAACGHAHGIPFTANMDGKKDDSFSAPAEMPA
ncbi:MAG: hypothetical protein KAR40_11130 [Candidatus Sabulitectum sp.]|nr:hypothetical protein [Candidatus Sabulitectum sp.]